MDYKEYSRLRSIARKRIERASAAGRMQYVKIPTVAEVRASANPSEYMNAVRNFLNIPESSLKVSKALGISMPKLDIVPLPPVTKRSLSAEEKAARRREQSRRSKAKRAVREMSKDVSEANKRVGYLKGLETVTAAWKNMGVDVADFLGVLSPKKAKQFTDYMEYRFSQGDYNSKYVIDTFIRDFGALVKKGYNLDDIQKDFDSFLEKQKELGKNKKNTNKYGIAEDEVDKAWRKFVKNARTAKDTAAQTVKKAIKIAKKLESLIEV